jgi:hypothetical protein
MYCSLLLVAVRDEYAGRMPLNFSVLFCPLMMALFDNVRQKAGGNLDLEL